MSTSKRKYFRCDECGHKQLTHMRELSRRSRLRCAACGSQWMDPVAEETSEMMRLGETALKEQIAAKNTPVARANIVRRPPAI